MLGEKIDELHSLKKQLREANKAVSELKESISELESGLIEDMALAGLTQAAGENMSVSTKEEVVANIEDWETFTQYVAKNDAFYLIQHRVNNAPFREHQAAGEKIPGLTPYTKVKLNTRSK